MGSEKIIELAFYTLPAIITGFVAYYLFNSYFADQQNTRRWLVQKENQKQSLPLRLQAYERLTLFLERIQPTKLLIRIAPISEDKNDYENYVIAQIEQEFEHNLTQQIYVSAECWSTVLMAKNATIQLIRKTNMSEKITDADKLRQAILSDSFDKATPSSAALSVINDEVKSFL